MSIKPVTQTTPDLHRESGNQSGGTCHFHSCHGIFDAGPMQSDEGSSSSQFVHHVRLIESTSLASATVRSNVRTKATCGPLPDLNLVFEVLSNLDVDLPQGRSRPSCEERVRCVPACTSKPRRHRPTNIATDTWTGLRQVR